MRTNKLSAIGFKIRKRRELLGLSLQDVENASRKIAKKLQDPRYNLTKSYISKIEITGAVPSLYKLFSFSVIYRMDILEMMALYEIDVYQKRNYDDCLDIKKTHLMDFYGKRDEKVSVPLRFDPFFSPDKTALLNRVIQEWTEISFEFFSRMNFRKFLYAYIGEEDNYLYPYIRNGAIVKIDPEKTEIRNSGWSTYYERPIYFLQTHQCYICSHCNLKDKELYVIPYPSSNKQPEKFKLNSEVIILGEVVEVLMNLAPRGNSSEEQQEPPEN